MQNILFLTLFLIPLNTFAETLSLEKAVNIGIKNNHMINSKMAQIKGSKADLRKTKNEMKKIIKAFHMSIRKEWIDCVLKAQMIDMIGNHMKCLFLFNLLK